MTTVINIKKENLKNLGYESLEEWKKNKKHLYIGRNMSFYVAGSDKSKWSNPFSLKKFGRDECLKLYEEYIIKNTELYNALDELDGLTLGCWCAPSKCHGDVLIKLLEQKKQATI
jgi:hypothetical protein